MEHFLYALQNSYRAYRLQSYLDSIPYYILGWIIGVIVVTVIAGIAGRRWWLFLLIGIFASPLVSLVVLLIMCACGAGKITVTPPSKPTTPKNKEETYVPSFMRNCTNVEQGERDLSDVPSSTLKFNREED